MAWYPVVQFDCGVIETGAPARDFAVAEESKQPLKASACTRCGAPARRVGIELVDTEAQAISAAGGHWAFHRLADVTDGWSPLTCQPRT